MKILYIAHRVPYPPDKGDKLRAFRELEQLGRRHRVWCACFMDTAADRHYVDRLAQMCEDVAVVRLNRPHAALRGLSGLIRGKTLTEFFYRQRAFRAALRRWSNLINFEAVVAFSSSMAPYALQIPAARRILDLCDLDSEKWLAYARASGPVLGQLYRIEGRRLAAEERSWFEDFDATILISEAEASALPQPPPRRRLHIVGNGVTLPDLGHTCRPVPANRPTVGFVGVMDYRPNIDAVRWFVQRCWGRVRAAHPDAVFRIVGRSPTRGVRRLAATAGVKVIGGVDDCTGEVSGFHVSVAPMQIARGVQNKVLEAMAAAKPVVLSRRAAEGIAGRHGREFLIADTPEDTAATVSRLLGNPAERERLGWTARQFVAANHRWEDEMLKFESIVTGMVSRSVLRQGIAVAAAGPRGSRHRADVTGPPQRQITGLSN